MDPDGFESAVDELIAHAIPSHEYMVPHLTESRPAVPRTTDESIEPESLIFNPERALVTLEQLDTPQEPPAFIVEGLLPAEVGVTNGPGGTGKTSLIESEAVHVVLGRPLYGCEVLRPGGVLYISQEDPREKMLYRLVRIIGEMNLSPGERERVGQSFYIEDLVDHRVRLVESDERGNLSRTDAADQLVDSYMGKGLSLVIVDPLIFFSAGERHMNDGAAELMLVGRRIARTLGCAVQFVHHCSIQTSRGKPDDQYAGRSAAAIADNARFVRNIYPYALADGDKFGALPPASVSREDIALKRLLVLKLPKLSDAPPVTNPIWILRHGWTFAHIESEQRTRDEVDRDSARQVCEFVTTEEARGVWHTANTLDAAYKSVGVPRNRLRALVNLCDQKGWLIPVEIPEGHPFRHAKRTHRLTVGLRP